MDQRQQRKKRAKRWEKQRREQQRQQDRQKEREQRQKGQEQSKTINDLPAEMVHEIFDSNPEVGLVLARTNKWFSEVLKDKIKKYRQLIRECNSASVCYSNSFIKILDQERKEAWKNNNTVIRGITYICYLQCLNCFRSFEYGYFPTYFLIRTMDEVQETGIVLCLKCTLKYHGKEVSEIMGEMRERENHNDLEYDSDDSSDDSEYYSEDEHYE
jgi:hypothetical protein